MKPQKKRGSWRKGFSFTFQQKEPMWRQKKTKIPAHKKLKPKKGNNFCQHNFFIDFKTINLGVIFIIKGKKKEKGLKERRRRLQAKVFKYNLSIAWVHHLRRRMHSLSWLLQKHTVFGRWFEPAWILRKFSW